MSKITFLRPQGLVLSRRLREQRRFIQVLTGARQVGKTTLATQVLKQCRIPYVFFSADRPTLRESEWIQTQWEKARLKLKEGKRERGVILVLDEVQKIPKWSSMVKHLWDQDTRKNTNIKVVLLGSAPLLMSQGLTESLAGRFETLHLPHWSFSEMKKAFHWKRDQYLFYGAYPGAASLIKEPNRWASYIRHSLIETTISRDVLLLSSVNKPALLRQLFEMACLYSGQILSYNKMVGRLEGAGNTTTLAHYLKLLEGAGMITGLQKYSPAGVRRKNSIPKLMVLNTALMTASLEVSLKKALANATLWGRIVESAVGAHLLNTTLEKGGQVFYWREGNNEVDFVLQVKSGLTAIEVKSGYGKPAARLSGLKAFLSAYPSARPLIVGGEDGIEIETFLSQPATRWAKP